MQSKATTVSAYLESLPEDRRHAIAEVRKIILQNLPKGYEESMFYGMITYHVPLSVYPDTYNKQPLMYAALASQKNHMAVYLCNAYGLPKVKEDLVKGFEEAGKKLDMGASCVRFKKLSELPLPVIGEAIAATPMDRFVEFAKSQHTKEAREARKPQVQAARERGSAKAAAKSKATARAQSRPS